MAKTKLEQEKEKKREAWQAEEYLKDVDKRGPKATIEDAEKEKTEKRKAEDDQKTDLQSRKQLFSYEEHLARYGQEELRKLDFPNGWSYDAIPTYGRTVRIYGRSFKSQRGVLFILRSLFI